MDDDWKSVGTNSIIIYLNMYNIYIYIVNIYVIQYTYLIIFVIVCIYTYIYITSKHSNFPPKTIGFLPPVKATMDAGRGASNAQHNLQQLGNSFNGCMC